MSDPDVNSVGNTLRRLLGGLLQATGAHDLWLDTADVAGKIVSKRWHSMLFGLEAAAGRLTDFRRYGYPDSAKYVGHWDLSPHTGSWMLLVETKLAGSIPLFWNAVGGLSTEWRSVGIVNVGAAPTTTIIARRALPNPQHNTEVAAASTPWIYKVTGLRVDFEVGGDTVALYQQAIGAGGDTARELMYFLTATGTDTSLGAGAVAELNWSTHEYYVEWDAGILAASGGASASRIRGVYVDFEKRAVE